MPNPDTIELTEKEEQRLRDALAKTQRDLQLSVPERVDEQVLSLIQTKAAQVKDFRRLMSRYFVASVAAAAAVFVVFVVSPRLLSPQQKVSIAVPAAAPDRVDIVDAYRLARRLKSGGDVPDAWDVNRDGQVDEQDVDALARRAVSVSGPGEKHDA